MVLKVEEVVVVQFLIGDYGDKEINGDVFLVIEDNRLVGFKKEVILFNGIVFVVGVIIGFGIFIFLIGVFKRIGFIGMSLVVWVGCGFFVFLGFFCYCEMGIMIFKFGVEYFYLYEVFGVFFVFFYSWIFVLIIWLFLFSVVVLIFVCYVSQFFFFDCEISLIFV